MKAVGLALFVVGTALATSFAARTVDGSGAAARLSAWWGAVGVEFAFSLAVMVVGVVLARRHGDRRVPAASGTGRAAHARDGLQRIVSRVAELPDVGAGTHDDLSEGLDDVLEKLVPDFLEWRGELIDELGLLEFAQLMSPFASFERHAARAWSALTDDALEEAAVSLDAARASLAEAHALLSRAR